MGHEISVEIPAVRANTGRPLNQYLEIFPCCEIQANKYGHLVEFAVLANIYFKKMKLLFLLFWIQISFVSFAFSLNLYQTKLVCAMYFIGGRPSINQPFPYIPVACKSRNLRLEVFCDNVIFGFFVKKRNSFRPGDDELSTARSGTLEGAMSGECRRWCRSRNWRASKVRLTTFPTCGERCRDEKSARLLGAFQPQIRARLHRLLLGEAPRRWLRWVEVARGMWHRWPIPPAASY